MGLTVRAVNLASRTVRRQVTSSSSGLRSLSTLNRFLSEPEQADSGGGLIGFVGRLFSRTIRLGGRGAGWILRNLLGFASFSFSSLWSWLVNSGQRIVNFDWNASDAQLRQQATGGYLASAAIWGSVVGSGLGWTAGIGLGYGVSMLCPVIGGAALARYISGQVAQEGLEEVGQNLRAALGQTMRAMTNQASISLYVNSRKFLKRNRDNLASLLARLGYAGQAQDLKDAIDNWGSDNGPRITISEQFEEQIERLPLPIQIFAEEAVDEFFDSFIEAGYIIAQELDTALTAARAATPENPERGLLLYPDRDNPNDKIVLSGPQDQIIAQAQSAIQTHRALEGRDVGAIAAVPAYEFATPATSRYTLTLHFNEFEMPPFTRNGRRGRSAKLKVPDSRLGISFNQLKIAFRPFTWGGIRATTKLDNGRQLAVYGASESECNDVMRSLLSFTSREQTRTVYTDVNSGVSPNQRKDPTRMYPQKATMAIRSLNQISGRYDVKTQTIYLWRTTPVGLERFGAIDPFQPGDRPPT